MSATDPNTPPPGRKTGRTMPPRRPTLDEPVVCGQFWRNRRGEAVRVELRSFEGVTICDVRQCFTAADGVLRPTKKGIALNVLRLPDLVAAITKAHAKAVELGLLGDEAAS